MLQLLRSANGVNRVARLSGIGAKRAYLLHGTTESARSWRPLDRIIGVRDQTGTNHEVGHPD